jgi:phytoene desaturase
MRVKIRLNSGVDEILVENGKAEGVRVAGKNKTAELVVANADLIYTHKQLIPVSLRPHMPNTRLESYTQASSALLFYWGVDGELKGMLHHNVLLARNFKKNLDEIFYLGKQPLDPSFYVYVPTKTDPSLAPKGKQVMYVLVPVPNLQATINWPRAIGTIRRKVQARIKREFGIDLAGKVESESVFTPQDFKDKFNLHVGSAFGLSHTFFQSGSFRPSNKSSDIENLYFVGASTYPGGGIPMVTLSAKLVVERILNEKQ